MAKKSTVKNLATEEKVVEAFKSEADSNYNRFKTDREDIDDINEVADYMYACAQNRSIMSSEKSKGMDREADTRANVGSTIFFRQVNQLASQLVNVARARQDLFRYVVVGNKSNGLSEEDAKQVADQANALARWTLKQDSFQEKLPEFAVHAFKYSNVFALIHQHRTYGRRVVKQPKMATSVRDGEVVSTQVDEVERIVEEPKENYPSITFPHVDMIFADRYIKDIESQNCIVLPSKRTRAEIYEDVMKGYFDEDQYAKLTDDMQWDGSTTAEQTEKEFANRERDHSPSKSGLFLQWDVLMRCPISDNGEWDDEDNPPVIYWGTVIGNTINDGIMMRLERNPDPDDEFPLKAIRVNPDSSSELYHTTNAEVVRSGYSAECTLMNMALDNMGDANDPPLLIVDGAHRIRNFKYRKGARWHVDNLNAVKQMDIRDNTIQTTNLMDVVEKRIRQALITDPALMGEYAGSRTSASEFLGVNSNTKMPHLVQIGYILQQLLPWMARKYVSYWYKYGLPKQYAQITDADKPYEIYIKDVAAKMQFGFDVVVDIVDEYEDDLVKAQQTASIMQTIGGSPFFQQSQSHSVNAGELLKEWLAQLKWPAQRIINEPMGIDAESAASGENNTMLNAGVYDRPQQGENHPVHLRVHKAERLRWKGIENSTDPRAVNLQLLDQHIAEHEMLMQGGGGSAPPPAPSGNQTPGEVVGNQAAGAMGALA